MSRSPFTPTVQRALLRCVVEVRHFRRRHDSLMVRRAEDSLRTWCAALGAPYDTTLAQGLALLDRCGLAGVKQESR